MPGALKFPGQLIAGGSESVTVTAKEQLTPEPFAQVTVVVPT
jgi:hypothetical protein